MNRIALLTILTIGGLSISHSTLALSPIENRISYVRDIQASITTYPEYGDRLRASIDEAKAKFDARLAELKLPKINLRFLEPADDNGQFTPSGPCKIIIQCPNECDDRLRFEFFLTQRSDVHGVTVTQTSLLGVDKYNNGPNMRSISFDASVFAFADNPAVVVHVEAIDESGVVVAGEARVVVVVKK